MFGLLAGALAGGVEPTGLLVLGLLGGSVAVLAATRLEIAVCLYVFIVFTSASMVVSDKTGIPLLAEMALALILVAYLSVGRTTDLPLSPVPKVLVVTGPFVLFSLATYFWASVPSQVIDKFDSYVRFLVVMVVVVATVRSLAMLRLVVWTIIAGGAFLGFLGLLQWATASYHFDYFGFANVQFEGLATRVSAHRLGGPIGEPNFFAQRLIIVLPLAVERMIHEERLLLRFLALVSAALVVPAIVLTYSRGGFLALAVVIAVCAYWLRPRRSTVVVGIAVIGVLLLVAPAAYVQRVTNLRQALSAERTYDTSIRGRTSEALVATRMLGDAPLGGVGSGNYIALYSDYAPEVGLDTRPFRFAHSLYLEVAAENGIIGLILFGVILVSAYRGVTLGARRTDREGLASYSAMLRAIRLALTAHLITALFLHGSFQRMFWVLIGLCIAAPYLLTPSCRQASPGRGRPRAAWRAPATNARAS